MSVPLRVLVQFDRVTVSTPKAVWSIVAEPLRRSAPSVVTVPMTGIEVVIRNTLLVEPGAITSAVRVPATVAPVCDNVSFTAPVCPINRPHVRGSTPPVHVVNLSLPFHVPVRETGCGLGAVASELHAVSTKAEHSIRASDQSRKWLCRAECNHIPQLSTTSMLLIWNIP